MKKENDKGQIYDRELNCLEKAKEIEKDRSLSQNELLDEFAQLRKEYDKLLKKTIKITHIGDVSQRKLMRLWKLEQEKQRLGQIVKEKADEIEEKNRQLEKQSDKLHELDRMKSRFFANISHEFRTPLSLIMGPLEQIHQDCRDSEMRRKISLMLRNSQRLLNLINQLLDLSKLDSGKMKIQVSPQNIIPFLKGIMNSFSSLAAENELDFAFFSPDEDIKLLIDSGKLEDVIGNLLINAVKFTPPGGEITLSVVRADKKVESYPSGHIEISVRDTGIGIPGDQLSNIFDRFYQGERLGKYEHKGTGIGLAVARELVILHHGDISVHSREGEGTEFIVRLPLGDSHYKPAEIVANPVKPAFSESQRVRPELLKDEKSPVDSDRIPDAPAPGKDYRGKKKSIILIVEDNVEMRYYLRGVLETSYRVEEAKNGGEGIKKARKIIPDLIISDVMMPGIDGCELCGVLKKDIKTSHIPIILLTAKASEESIVAGLETGADDYIIKPFSTKILNARVKNLIALRRQLQLKLQQQKPLQPEELSLSQLDKEFITEFREIIYKNLSNPDFNVAELRKKLYMSRATLYRKVEALTGEHPSDFIRSRRLQRGAELLKKNFGSVTDVSTAVGFSSSAYFTKCFKERFGQLPSAFRP
ncbi:ATP-binding protein [Acidobacteriota bacterium]